jgi:hypothetical protein
VEIVAKDTQFAVYPRHDMDNPAGASGLKATGIFVVDGKPQRIEMRPESGHKLSGISTVTLPAALAKPCKRNSNPPNENPRSPL